MLFSKKVHDPYLWAASMFGLRTYDDSYICVFGITVSFYMIAPRSLLTKLWVA